MNKLKANSVNSAFYQLFAVNALIYGLNAVFTNFIPLYLNSIFDSVQVGILLSIGPFVGIIAPNFWGGFIDRASSKNKALSIIIGFSAIAFIGIFLFDSFIYKFILVSVYMAFACVFGGAVDTISIEAAKETGKSYGPLRLAGTLGYGILSVILGFFPKDQTWVYYLVFAIIAAFSIWSTMTSPKIAGHARGKAKQTAYHMFKNKNLIIIIIVNIVIMFAHAFYQNFMSAYMIDGLGLSTTVWGITAFATLVLEIPMFIFYDKIYKRFSIKTLLIICLVTCVIRYSVFAFATKGITIIICSLFTGSWVTMATYSATYFITRTARGEVIASAQQLLYAAITNIPRIFAGLLGGVMVKAFNISNTYLIIAGICLLTFIPVFFLPKTTDEICDTVI